MRAALPQRIGATLIAGAAWLAAGTASAHHSFSAFDMSNESVIEGSSEVTS